MENARDFGGIIWEKGSDIPQPWVITLDLEDDEDNDDHNHCHHHLPHQEP